MNTFTVMSPSSGGEFDLGILCCRGADNVSSKLFFFFLGKGCSLACAALSAYRAAEFL